MHTEESGRRRRRRRRRRHVPTDGGRRRRERVPPLGELKQDPSVHATHQRRPSVGREGAPFLRLTLRIATARGRPTRACTVSRLKGGRPIFCFLALRGAHQNFVHWPYTRTYTSLFSPLCYEMLL